MDHTNSMHLWTTVAFIKGQGLLEVVIVVVSILDSKAAQS